MIQKHFEKIVWEKFGFEFKNITKVEDLFNSKFLVRSKFHTDNLITSKK